MKSFFTLLKNELKLNIRDMNMVIFAIIMPLAVMVILGIIYGSRPAYDGAAYTFMEQSFGAACAISMCAGGWGYRSLLPIIGSAGYSSVSVPHQSVRHCFLAWSLRPIYCIVWYRSSLFLSLPHYSGRLEFTVLFRHSWAAGCLPCFQL